MNFEPLAPRTTGRSATGLTFGGRRRRRVVRNRRFLGVVAVVTVLGGPVAFSPQRFAASDDATAATAWSSADEVSRDAAAAPPAQEQRQPPALFARYGRLELSLPASSVRLVAFHEASYPDALALTPVGRLLANDNVTKFQPPASSRGPDYVVLSSRGRANPATSAVDVAIQPNVQIVSPVTGTVTGVETYWLYGRHEDTRIEIQPSSDPDLRIVLIHVEDVRVAVGDTVVAGRSALAARGNHFPFYSHVDRYVPSPPGPHVHIEVKPVGREVAGGTTASG